MLPSNQPALLGLDIDLTIISGKNLVAKDRNFFGLGKQVSSDPFVEIYYGGRKHGETQVIDKNLNPVWNESFKIMFDYKDAQSFQLGKEGFQHLQLRIFDHDDVTSHDFMGACRVPITVDKPPRTSWYKVLKKDGNTENGKLYCYRATGDLQVKIAVAGRK